MKNLSVYLALLLILSGTAVLNSCSSGNEIIEQEEINLSEGIDLTDGILTFSSIDLYEETIHLLSSFDDRKLDQWEKSYNYISLRSQNEEPLLIGEIGNTFATLLNPTKEIIIAGNYFQLDFEKEKVFKKKIFNSCEFKSTELSGDTYSFTDDVDIFNDEPIIKSSSYSCPYGGRLWTEINTLSNGHAYYRLKYDAYLIYYHVRAEIEPDDTPSIDVWITANSSENRYNRRNRNGCTFAGDFWGHRTGEYLQWTLYEGTRKLSAFSFKVTFKACYEDDQSDLSTRIATLNCSTVEDCP